MNPRLRTRLAAAFCAQLGAACDAPFYCDRALSCDDAGERTVPVEGGEPGYEASQDSGSKPGLTSDASIADSSVPIADAASDEQEMGSAPGVTASPKATTETPPVATIGGDAASPGRVGADGGSDRLATDEAVQDSENTPLSHDGGTQAVAEAGAPVMSEPSTEIPPAESGSSNPSAPLAAGVADSGVLADAASSGPSSSEGECDSPPCGSDTCSGACGSDSESSTAIDAGCTDCEEPCLTDDCRAWTEPTVVAPLNVGAEVWSGVTEFAFDDDGNGYLITFSGWEGGYAHDLYTWNPSNRTWSGPTSINTEDECSGRAPATISRSGQIAFTCNNWIKLKLPGSNSFSNAFEFAPSAGWPSRAAITPQGDVVVTWLHGSGQFDVWARRWSFATQTWGATEALEETAMHSTNVQVGILNDDSVLFAWEGSDGISARIWEQGAAKPGALFLLGPAGSQEMTLSAGANGAPALIYDYSDALTLAGGAPGWGSDVLTLNATGIPFLAVAEDGTWATAWLEAAPVGDKKEVLVAWSEADRWFPEGSQDLSTFEETEDVFLTDLVLGENRDQGIVLWTEAGSGSSMVSVSAWNAATPIGEHMKQFGPAAPSGVTAQGAFNAQGQPVVAWATEDSVWVSTFE